MLNIEVAYANSGRAQVLALSVLEGCTAFQAIVQSGIAQSFPDINLAALTIGVFGRRVALEYPVQAGDRIEIYRPLLNDPKTRRLRQVKQEHYGKRMHKRSSKEPGR